MSFRAVRNGAHQGVVFTEVQEVNANGQLSPVVFAVPGTFDVGAELDVTVTEVKTAAEVEAEAQPVDETKAEVKKKAGK